MELPIAERSFQQSAFGRQLSQETKPSLLFAES
jgi:hypothetical protein